MVGLSGCGVLWCASSWRMWCAGQVVGEQWCLVVLGFSRPPRRGLTSTQRAALLSQGKYGKKHPANMESGPCVGVFLEEHGAALLKLQAAFSNQCSLSPTDPSLVFLPAVTSEEVFIFMTGYTEAVIPCRVTNPQMQVTLYEKKVENPIPATYDPQQGFKGFFEDKSYFCRTFVDDQEVDSDTFYVYRIQGELTLS